MLAGGERGSVTAMESQALVFEIKWYFIMS